MKYKVTTLGTKYEPFGVKRVAFGLANLLGCQVWYERLERGVYLFDVRSPHDHLEKIQTLGVTAEVIK